MEAVDEDGHVSDGLTESEKMGVFHKKCGGKYTNVKNSNSGQCFVAKLTTILGEGQHISNCIMFKRIQ